MEASLKRSTERILTTHTGSLPRPSDLDQMLFDREDGKALDPATFEARVRDVVDEIVQLQLAAGIDVVNDGEVGRIGFFSYVKDRLGGFGGETVALAPAEMLEFPEVFKNLLDAPSYAHLKLPACNAPIDARDNGAVQKELDNLKASLLKASLREERPADVFMSAASPGLIAGTLGNIHYPSHEEYVFALAEAMKSEYDAIAGAGVVLQVDAPDLAAFRAVGPNSELSDEEFLDQVRMHVRALNHALRDIEPERMRMHMCWGNAELPHVADIPLAKLVDAVLEARPAALSIAACNPRHEHEWRVWEDVKLPEGKVLIPGVIDSTTNYVEHPELVAQRIERYTRVLGRENVIAGCDCGFGSLAGLYPVAPRVAWLKLKALAEGARLASERLW
jgi:5-methyltetrahydropteroyltriglutamate--homocysteine methyltransferase